MALQFSDDPLKAERVQARVRADLPGWTCDPGCTAITRTYHLPTFRAAIAFVGFVAEVAEALGHHPEIDVRYDRVTLRLTTRDVGGVTEKDLELARAVDGRPPASRG